MLLEQGMPVSLILDDPLVYSDDGRLDLMTEILEEASQRMQVILLTCRDRAFRHLQAQRVQPSAHSKDRNSMKLLRHSGNERVIDRLRAWLQTDAAKICREWGWEGGCKDV